MEGWIKIHRAMLDWEWFDKPEMVKFFIYCLCKANFEDRKWHGIEIKRGQFLTSLDNMSKDTRFSKQTLRTCIARLKSTQELTHQSTRTYTIITICNYDTYQQQENETNTPINTPSNTPLTHEQHTANTPLTLTKELKNIRIKERKKEYTHNDGGDAALPSPSEILEVEILDSEINESTTPKLEPEKAPPIAAAPPAPTENEATKQPTDQPAYGTTDPQAPRTPPPNAMEKNFIKFRTWIAENAPRVAMFKEPFTLEQFERLKKDFALKEIQTMILAMHNYKPLLNKNVSANLTFRSWANRDKENATTNTKTSRTSVPSTSDGYSTDLPD